MLGIRLVVLRLVIYHSLMYILYKRKSCLDVPLKKIDNLRHTKYGGIKKSTVMVYIINL